MRIEQFLYLKKIAETQSINLACKSLFITQQALSRSIISLEEELGVQLLNRNKHGVTLTVEGEYVLKEGNKVLDVVDNIRNHFLSERISSETKLNISTTPLINQYILSSAITYFYKNFPTIKIDIDIMSANDTIIGLLDNTLDIGFVTEFSYNNISNLILPHNLKYIPVFSSPISLLISRNSSLNYQKSISLCDLQDKKVIFLKDSIMQNDMLKNLFKTENIPEIITVDNELLFHKMIADDIGFSFFVTINDLYVNTKAHPNIAMRPLTEHANLSLGYVIHDEDYEKNIFAQIFCEHLL